MGELLNSPGNYSNLICYKKTEIIYHHHYVVVLSLSEESEV